MRNLPRLRALAALLALAPAALAAVLSRDLGQMVSRSASVRTKADDALAGTIVSACSYDLDTGERRMRFTTLELEGVSLFDGLSKRIAVSFAGGPGELNHTMPPLEDTRVGQRVVILSAYCPTMGGGAGMNALVCGFGGLYRIERNAAGEEIVIGRGPGCAIERSLSLAELRARISALRGGARKVR